MLDRNDLLKVILMEELGEFAQAISKTLRFTDAHRYPEYLLTNAETAQLEFNDVIALCEMVSSDTFAIHPDQALIESKKARVEESLLWSAERGALDETSATESEETIDINKKLALYLVALVRQGTNMEVPVSIEHLLSQLFITEVPGVTELANHTLSEIHKTLNH